MKCVTHTSRDTKNGNKYCDECHEKDKSDRKEILARGFCAGHRSARLVDGKTICAECVAYYAAYRKKAKALAIEALGGRCECCGETNIGFLTVDHKNNDGNKMRKIHGTGWSAYREYVKEGAAERLGLRVLCYNCNCGRDKNGGICPHEQQARALFLRSA